MQRDWPRRPSSPGDCEKTARWDARAGVARLYPWGDSFGQSRANTREGSGSGTTAVGSYPSGASLYGAEEMAGNVWEWAHSLFKHYPYSGSDGREDARSTESRVLRGGSWGYLRQLARAAARYLSLPGYHYINFGFRLVVESAGS